MVIEDLVEIAKRIFPGIWDEARNHNLDWDHIDILNSYFSLKDLVTIYQAELLEKMLIKLLDLESSIDGVWDRIDDVYLKE